MVEIASMTGLSHGVRASDIYPAVLVNTPRCPLAFSIFRDSRERAPATYSLTIFDRPDDDRSDSSDSPRAMRLTLYCM